MVQPENEAEFSIRFDDVDGEEAELLARRLRGELLRLDDVQSVGYLPVETPAPAGAKSAVNADFASLVVKVALESIPAVVALISEWLVRSKNRKVKVSLKSGDREATIEYLTRQFSEKEVKQTLEYLLQPQEPGG